MSIVDNKVNNIIIGYGTYDRCIFGLKFNDTYDKLYQVFGTDAHDGCVKVVNGCNGIWMASGGTDETIRVYNAKDSIDYGQLYGHEGSINTLEFFNNTHLLSGSEDGTIRIWQTNAWTEGAVLKSTNNSGVRDLSIHPSGKVALSVHNDSTLKMWDLIKGRLVLSTNLKKSGYLVQWSPSGEYYGIVSDSFNRQVYFSCTLLTLFSASGESKASLEHEQKILCCKFLNENFIACGCENGIIYIWDIKQSVCVMKLIGHTVRVRNLDLVDNNNNNENEWPDIISGASNGEIAYWKLDISQLVPNKLVTIEPNVLHTTTHRITSLCIIRPDLATKKRKIQEIPNNRLDNKKSKHNKSNESKNNDKNKNNEINNNDNNTSGSNSNRKNNNSDNKNNSSNNRNNNSNNKSKNNHSKNNNNKKKRRRGEMDNNNNAKKNDKASNEKEKKQKRNDLNNKHQNNKNQNSNKNKNNNSNKDSNRKNKKKNQNRDKKKNKNVVSSKK